MNKIIIIDNNPMMEKYGTYVSYQNIETKEIIDIPLSDNESITKYASDEAWREYTNVDRDEEKENFEHSKRRN